MTISQKKEIGKVYFEEGIPGFARLQFYQLIQEENGIPIYLLQSTEEEAVGFWVVDPFVFFREYQFRLPEQVKESLHLSDEKEVLVFNIITPRENGITVNLKAPIVINWENRMGKQVILEEDYQIRHPLIVHDLTSGGA
jgi:flagellar assembly factor FliW